MDARRSPCDGRLSAATILFQCLLAVLLAARAHADLPEAPPARDTRAGRGNAARHWAFEPIGNPSPPAVTHASWVRTPVDSFVLSALERRGWEPAPEAPRRTLIRRLSFDLTGLPPSPDAIDAFESDPRPDAYERLVDRLLAEPAMGERWAQHWLDVVRYAETEGFEYDGHLPDAWRYRDYVVGAFNADLPYSRFVLEQLAGDEAEPATEQGLAAAILHRLGPVRRNAGNPEIALSRNEVLTERTDILGPAFLGMTVGCARCHDHKLDPVSQRDYYALQAYMAATYENNVVLASTAEREAWQSRTQPLQEQLQALRKQAEAASGDERVRLRSEIARLELQLPAPLPTIPSIRNDPAQRTPMHVLKRGLWEQKGASVGPRPPSVLVPADEPELPADVAHPRTRLASWLTSDRHPLTSRVIVNRLWQHHFGRGLVSTPNDFGTHGSLPSHPDLLDWLAQRLVEDGWRLKTIHRCLLLSSTYRQASVDAAGRRVRPDDPSNRWLSRFQRRRLSAEEIRDAMLVVSGSLTTRLGGRSVLVPVDPDLVKLLYKPAQWTVSPDLADHDRRSIYLMAKRNLRLPFLVAFDQPALLTSCGRRESSTHAPQSLELLNGRLSNQLALRLAGRLEREAGTSSSRRATLAFRLALGREPLAVELPLAVAFLDSQPAREFALALFNLNEFLHVD